MEDNNSTDCFHDGSEEIDRVLSLADLPLDVEEEITTSQTPLSSSSSSSSTETYDGQCFEFLNDISSDMYPAEDVIFCGKLMPSCTASASSRPLQQIKSLYNEVKSQGALHRRSEFLSNLQSYATRSSSADNCQFLRISRSLDYQKLRRFGCPETASDLDIRRSASLTSVGKADDNKKAASKPKRYLPIFGLVKSPLEMDIRDIKSRQFRRSSPVMFPSFDSEGKFPAKQSTGKSSSSSWRFVEALSCSDHSSVAVTASLCATHARGR